MWQTRVVIAVVAAFSISGCSDSEETLTTAVLVPVPDREAPHGPLYDESDPHWKIDRRSRDLTAVISEGWCPAHESHRDVVERLVRIDVDETDDAVTLTVKMRPAPNGDEDCFGVGTDFERQVHLTDPVGGRALIDGGRAADDEERVLLRAVE